MSKVIKLKVIENKSLDAYEKDEFIYIGNQKDLMQDVALLLHDDCNLHCKFCYEDGKTNLPSRTFDYSRLIANMETLIEKSPRQMFNVMLYGGELFQDKFDSSVFDGYNRCLESLDNLFAKYNKDRVYKTSSHFVHVKRDRVVSFCRHWDMELMGSFDLVNRYRNNKQAKTFLESIEFYNGKGFDIAMQTIMSRSNVEAMYNESDYFWVFKELYDKLINKWILSHYDTTTQNVGLKEALSEQQVFEFFKYCHLNYPKLLNDVITSDARNGCCSAIVDNNHLYFACTTKERVTQFYNNKGCLACKYYKRCNQQTCIACMFDLKDCHLRMFYEWLDSQEDRNKSETI